MGPGADWETDTRAWLDERELAQGRADHQASTPDLGDTALSLVNDTTELIADTLGRVHRRLRTTTRQTRSPLTTLTRTTWPLEAAEAADPPMAGPPAGAAPASARPDAESPSRTRNLSRTRNHQAEQETRH